MGIFLLFLGTGILVLVLCPPIWRDYDGLIQISTRPSDMTILQYPVAYPLFSRVHVYAVTIVQGWIHHHKANIDIAKGWSLNDGGIHALMISQEVAAGPRADRFCVELYAVGRARGSGSRSC